MINKKRSSLDWIPKHTTSTKEYLVNDEGDTIKENGITKIFQNIFEAQDYIRIHHCTGFYPKACAL